MERGEIGLHHACAEEQILVGTGKIIQRHDALPTYYIMPQGHTKCKWIPLVEPVAKTLQLDESCRSPEAAKITLERVEDRGEEDVG